ncbi:MAG: glycosyltransferase [Myxococcota bacterium]
MSAAPRLALFLRSLGADGAGAERNALILAGDFAARGFPVDLVLARRRGHLAQDVPPEVRTIELGTGGVAGPWRAAFGDPRGARRLGPALSHPSASPVLGAAPALADYLRRERPRALLSFLTYGNVTALWARARAGVDTRIAISERNTLSARARSARGRRWRVLPALATAWYPDADAILAVSAGVAADLAAVTGLGPERIRVTGNPVVTPDLPRLAEQRPVHPWCAPEAPPLVLAVGKLKPQKGFDVLLDAFARLRSQRVARLAILGVGPERGALERQAARLGLAQDVAFPGFVANPFAWMAQCALFVCSSRFEGLPGALIQALACGAPVVSTACPSGPTEILGDTLPDALVPVEDAAALAAAMARTLEAPGDAATRRRCAARFSVERVAPRYLEAMCGSSVRRKSASSAATAAYP